jgi:hypothetical protein
MQIENKTQQLLTLKKIHQCEKVELDQMQQHHLIVFKQQMLLDVQRMLLRQQNEIFNIITTTDEK